MGSLSAMPARTRSKVVVLALMVLTAAGACSSTAEPAVQKVAQSFQASLRADDTQGACEMLSEEARNSLELTSARRCPAAIDALNLRSAPPTTEVHVWGDNAQVQLSDSDGVLFLANFPTGWKVTGAGCHARSEQPYACAVRS